MTVTAPADALERPLSVPTEAYLSPGYARAERDQLWRKVWLQAGRLEDIPGVGDFITYDILDDSVIIVRTGPVKEHVLRGAEIVMRSPALMVL